MSEDGEAGFDAGQSLEDAPRQILSPANPQHEQRSTVAPAEEPATGEAAGSNTAPGPVAPDSYGDSRYAHSSSGRRSEHDARLTEALPLRSPETSRRAVDDNSYYRRDGGQSRSRSRNRSQSRDRTRRAAPSDYSGEYRSGSYRVNRYGERELSRSGYYRRNERESTGYRRRDPERQPYSRSGYSARDEAEAGDASRRTVDKERAIEELRLRVRSATDRPADSVPPAARERSSYAAAKPSDGALATQSQSTLAPETLTTRAVADAVPAAATSEPTVDMDDIEEGEHIEIEGEMEVARPSKSDNIREKTGVSMRNRSRSNSSYGRGRAGKERSRSRTRAYHESEDRRAIGGGQDSSNNGAHRRRYDDQADRGDYRSREPYGSRSAQYSRYDDAGYRSERRYFSSRYDRYGTADSRTPTDYRYPAPSSAVSPSRQPSRSRSRSPIACRDEDRRIDRSAYGDRYHHASRPMSRDAGPYSRSPSIHARDTSGANAAYGGSTGECRRSHYGESRWPGSEDRPRSPHPHLVDTDEAPLDGSDPANPPPPPPPPPVQSSGSAHGTSSFGGYTRTGSPLYHQHSQDSSYRSYSSRQLRRQSRSFKAGASSSRTPYVIKHEYDSHSRSPSNGGSYHPSRGQSPGAGASVAPPVMDAAASEPPVQPELVLPPFSHGTDLYISRFPESSEWLEIRAQVREQAKRVLELSSGSRKTGFEMTYAGWGVNKAEGQAQLALWQIERAEQGLGAVSSHSLMAASTLNDL
ncbi:hypothetical protein GGI20_003226 [Coemansia sp. BCRC 34301]|nr:hypothetical protein GGI20_003226 [Coemansia sp. BCRC 34301]